MTTLLDGNAICDRCKGVTPLIVSDVGVTIPEKCAHCGAGLRLGSTVPEPEDRITLDLSRNEIFWLASCHMLTVMIADGRPPAAVSAAYKLMKQNATDLGTDGINELYTRISMIVQAKWPESTTFVFPDENEGKPQEDSSELRGATGRVDKNVS